jgi:hypothetical protein
MSFAKYEVTCRCQRFPSSDPGKEQWRAEPCDSRSLFSVAAFGGPEQLATEFRSMFDESSDRGDHRTAAKILLAIGSLCCWFDPLSKDGPDTGKPATSTGQRGGMPDQPEDLSQVSDAQLKSKFRRLKKVRASGQTIVRGLAIETSVMEALALLNGF